MAFMEACDSPAICPIKYSPRLPICSSFRSSQTTSFACSLFQSSLPSCSSRAVCSTTSFQSTVVLENPPIIWAFAEPATNIDPKMKVVIRSLFIYLYFSAFFTFILFLVLLFLILQQLLGRRNATKYLVRKVIPGIGYQFKHIAQFRSVSTAT